MSSDASFSHPISGYYKFSELEVPHTRSINAVTFSPDGEYIASGASDGIIAFYSRSTQKLLYSTRHEDTQIGTLRWSSSTLFAGGSAGELISFHTITKVL